MQTQRQREGHQEWQAAPRILFSHPADFLAMRSLTTDLRLYLVRSDYYAN